MEISFKAGNTPIRLRRGWFLGGMKLDTPSNTYWLEHPANLRTHFSCQLTKSWTEVIDGHEVRIEKVRPMVIAGLRPQKYSVFVDRELVAESEGY